MVLSAAEIDGRSAIALLLTLASIGTFLHTGLKLPYFTFFGPKHQIKVKKLPVNMLLAMFITAGLCLFLGLYPKWLYTHLPIQPVLYEPYTMNHVVSTLQLLAGTMVGFWLLRSKIGGELTYSLDVDVLYRKPTAFLMNSFITSTKDLGRLSQQATTYILQALNGLVGVSPTSVLTYLERNLQPLNMIALWVLLLLVVLSLL
jgi:multicomponent Na+:H+ antiporter subunit D